jgi:sialidase-1
VSILLARRLRTAVASGVAAALVVSAAAALEPPRAVAATSPSCVATPFPADPAKDVWYRIPAIVRTQDGTLLAFAELRDSDDPATDTGDVDVVASRSSDAGCSWSAPEVIAANGTDTVGNPTPVVDRSTGDVLLLTVDRPQGGTSLHGLHVQRSTDDGRSWTPYDRAGSDLFGHPGWSGGLTGPGHAIQLATGPHAGRIVVPIGYQRNGKKGAYAILSDDGGRSWRVGFNALGDDTRQEGTVAQLPDGRLWISYHEQSQHVPIGKGRIAALSSDGGASLSSPFATLPLQTVSVQASALVLTGTHAGTLLLSSPGAPIVGQRRVMTIFTARTTVPGSSWARYPVTLDDTPAAYSDLVQVDDATVGVLYETGRASWHEGISYRTVPIAALTAGATVVPNANVTTTKRVRPGGTLAVTVRMSVPGTRAPAGTVRVRLSKAGWRKTVDLRLYNQGNGMRMARFAGLGKGRYTLKVTYLGTPRIKQATVTRTIRVR